MAEFRAHIFEQTKAVGGLPSEQLYNNVAPQSVSPPYVVFNVSDFEDVRHFEDVNELRRYVVDFVIVSVDNATSWTIGQNIKGVWDHVRQTANGRTTVSYVKSITDQWSVPRHGEEIGYHLVVVTISIWDSEA